MLEAARRRRRGGADLALPVAWQDLAKFAEAIRPKRANGAAADCTEKIFVPVPLKVKVVFMRLARELQVTQAELGLIVVEHAVRNLTWFEMAVKMYLASGRPWRGVPTSMHPRKEKRNP